MNSLVNQILAVPEVRCHIVAGSCKEPICQALTTVAEGRVRNTHGVQRLMSSPELRKFRKDQQYMSLWTDILEQLRHVIQV